MAAPFSVLHLVDHPETAEAVASSLAGATDRFAHEVADGAGEARSRIDAGDVDCLLADATLVTQHPDVLSTAAAADPPVPVVLTVAADAATPPTDALDRGATDFVRLADVRADGGVLATRLENALAGARASAGGGLGGRSDVREWTTDAGTPEASVGRRELEAVLDELGEGVFVADEDGTYRYVNSAGERITGYSPDELLAGGPELLFPDESERRKFDDAIRDLLSGGDRDVVTIEAIIETKAGESVPIEATLTLRSDDHGRHRGVVGVVRDVTERKTAERRFREYGAILRSFPDEIAVLDTDGVMQTVIPPTDDDLTTTGYDPAELEGQHVGIMMPDEALEEAIDLIVEMVETDREHGTIEFQLVGRNDERLWREAHVALLEDADGTTVGSVVTLRDLEERKARERELERFETLLELMPDAVVVTDLEGTVVEIHGDEGWSGHDHDDLVDEHMNFALTDESVERAEDVVADLLASDDRENATFELAIETAGGRTIPYENHITLLPPDDDDRIPGTMSVLRNISERKRRERELRRQNERLEQFASIASHDLRNPLNLAQGYMEMVEADGDTEHAESVVEALDRMEQLIEDTLTWARGGSTVTERSPIDLGTLAPDAWEAVGTESASLAVVDDVTVTGDGDRVRRLLENLLRNAVEHGGEDVHVEIGAIDGDDPVGTDADGPTGTGDAGRAGFYVADDGPGIPPDQHDSVFDAGFTTASDGTGFGLAIIGEICDAHGWEISVTDSESGGARFEITGVDVEN